MSTANPPNSEEPTPREDPALEALRGLLRERGVSEAEIERADEDGTLDLVAVDRLLAPESPALSLDDIAERSDVDQELRARMWRTMGLPEPESDAKLFSETDVMMNQVVQQLLGADNATQGRLLQIVRVLGSSMARIAEAQVGAIEAARDQRQQMLEDGVEDIPTFDTGLLLEAMPAVMDYTWRLHLRAAARRRQALRSSGITDELTVGFVDLVDFTRLSEGMDDDDLVQLVDTFEADAFDAVTRAGGQVVKTIGDAVMFSIRDTPAAANLTIELVNHFAAADHVTELRAGLATGPVIEKEGDLFGPTVNLASRLTGVAYPSAVVISESMAKELEHDESFVVSKIPAQTLKGIGRRVTYRIRHAADERPEGEDELARRRRRRERRRARNG